MSDDVQEIMTILGAVAHKFGGRVTVTEEDWLAFTEFGAEVKFEFGKNDDSITVVASPGTEHSPILEEDETLRLTFDNGLSVERPL